MTKYVPADTPRKTRRQIEDIMYRMGCPEFAVVGIRGYYRDSMGAPEKNDRGIYDDAIFIVTPTCFIAYNANCDPSVTRPGIANLVPGLYRYKLGIHNISKAKQYQYEALVQAASVRVQRDGRSEPERLDYTINIHRGSKFSTSSLGCQTIYPTQWDSFLSTVKSEMKRHKRKEIHYLLIEGQG